MNIKAVIFDIGGVVCGSPFTGIAKYETKYGLPKNYINVAIASRENGAFQRLERGELQLEEFYSLFGAELSDPANVDYYRVYAQRRNLRNVTIPEKIHIDGEELFTQMMREALRINPGYLSAIRRLREKGFKVAALTNNYPLTNVSHEKSLKANFDAYFESSVVGLRKPSPDFYLHACKALNLLPSEVVFLDDIGMNLKAARELGMQTIRVTLGRELEALEKLEMLLGVKLLDFEPKL
ncbi:uncharacterized protein VTP21DRAFT_324 [Calcarisporiella thermophila]|uniref:uncharacterized protein n=1 Tax=Calcarisporiella thermophila TaxID=911321 RepID=UPI003741EF78